MTDRESATALPPRPGTGRPSGAGFESGDSPIIVELQGQSFQLDPIQALALVSTVTATLEVYLRQKA